MANSPNQFKYFKGVNDMMGPIDFTYGTEIGRLNRLDKRYDEPTYMTFRVLFGQHSMTRSGTTLLNTDYDRMPHPLFINQQVDATQSSGPGGRNVIDFNRDLYSTIDFLRDSNEFTRAEMLKEFILVWEDLQKNFQWYFQSVDGLADLLKPAPGRGQRVSKDLRLTFNMLEGVDHRVSYLLNLYRKIAWDDTYQRWVLPDLMRFFDIQIFLTEFRTFHKSIVSPNSDEPVYLQILNGILPTYLIECSMCEFDIESFDFTYRNVINVNQMPEQTAVSFKVKVGNVNEVLTYPLFAHFVMDDYRLNGQERSKEKGLIKDQSGRVTNAFEDVGGQEIPREEDYISTQSGDYRYAMLDQRARARTQDTFYQDDHVSGTPYQQQTNRTTFFGERVGGKGTYLAQYSEDQTTGIDPMDPATWVGNAITFGKSFAVNFVTSAVNKGKMMKIPGLGFSYNQAIAAIESKDFNQVFGLIRRAIAESTAGTEAPSALLEQRIDSTFKEFLVGVSQSESTDGDQLEFIRAANMILMDGGQWQSVKDWSHATNMRGPQETNIPIKVEGQGEYKAIVATSIEPAINDYSWATDRDVQAGYIMEGPPSSATAGRRLEDEALQTATKLSTATGANLTDKGPSTDIISESTDGDNVKGEQLTTPIISESTDGDGVKGDLYKTEVISQATLKGEVKGEQLTTPIISESTDGDLIRGDLSKSRIISEATDGDLIKGDLLKTSIVSEATNDNIKGDMQTTDQLSEATRDRNHADKVVGDMEKTKVVSEATNDTLSGKKIGPSSEATDGDPIKGDMMTTNIKSEATDGDSVKEKLNQPNPSQATRNKIDNA